MPKGEFGVKQTDVTIRDGVREKDMELRVRVPIPAAGEKAPPEGWPLVVFSHGAGGSRDAFPALLDFWASHGFASIAITHEDSIQLKRREGDAPPLRELMTDKGRRELRNSVDLGDRVADCSLVLDRLDDISAATEKAGGRAFKVDRAKMAIAGHSAGAFTAQLCAGVKVRAAGVGQRGLAFTSVADDRFKAAIIISGQGTTSRILGDKAWGEVKVPLFVIGGSQDSSPPGMGPETPESRRHPYEYSRGVAKGGPPAYLMFIEGATHASYSGKAASGLLREKPSTDPALIGDAVATGTTLFLDAKLRASGAAERTLAGTRLGDTIPGKVTYEHK